MFLFKPYFKCHFMRNVLLAFLFLMFFASLCAAAERRLGAVAATQASHAAGQAAANSMGAGGSAGTDLRAISSPRTTPQTFTGFPAGTLPGNSAGGGGGAGGEKPMGKMVYSGDPLPQVIGFEMVGTTKLDRVCTIANHVGYTITRMRYSPTVMDMPYTFALMRGNRMVSTLYFNRSMTLVLVK